MDPLQALSPQQHNRNPRSESAYGFHDGEMGYDCYIEGQLY